MITLFLKLFMINKAINLLDIARFECKKIAVTDFRYYLHRFIEKIINIGCILNILKKFLYSMKKKKKSNC